MKNGVCLKHRFQTYRKKSLFRSEKILCLDLRRSDEEGDTRRLVTGMLLFFLLKKQSSGEGKVKVRAGLG